MQNNKAKILGITLVVSLGGFLFGFDASVISGVIKFIRPEFQLSEFQLGWIVSSPTFSAMFAMLFAGKLSDLFGRKKVLLSVAFLYIISAVLSALAVSPSMLVVARMIGGIAFGSALVIAPVYIAEIAPADMRGRLVSVQQLNIVLGFSVAYFSNYFLLRSIGAEGLITEATAWRWMLGIEAVPGILYFLLLFGIPSSPRWLFVKGKVEEAREILSDLHSPELADKEIGHIEESFRDKNTKPGIGELLKPRLRFILFIGLMLGIFQQITGINVIFFYATTIFEQTGIGADASFAQAILVGIINVIFTILAMTLIDKLGRKPLLIAGLAGIAISMAVTSYGFYQSTYRLDSSDLEKIEYVDTRQLASVVNVDYESDLSFKEAMRNALGEQQYLEAESDLLNLSIQSNATLILFGILGFVASFAFSLGPVMWVMLSELFPNYIRGLAISVIGFVNSLASWFIQFIFPVELAVLGNGLTYLLYAVFALVGMLIFIKILPETKGKSLEEIESQFASG